MKKLKLSISNTLLIFCLNLTGQIQPIFDVHLHAHDENDFVIPTLSRYVNPELGLQQTKTNEELFYLTDQQIKRFNLYCLTIGDSLSQDWKSKIPDRIFPSLLISDPSLVDIPKLRKEVKEGKWFCLGEIVSQYSNIAPNDSALYPIFDLAEELDAPVGIHIGMGPPGGNLNGESNFRNSSGTPLQLEDVLISHPKLRIYMMHAGWPMLDETIYMLHQYPNLYVDIALIDWAIPQKEFYYYLERLVNAGFSSRIMFGSDQMVWPGSIALAIQAINSASFLSEKQKRDIFYNNAVKFFKLTTEKPADKDIN